MSDDLFGNDDAQGPAPVPVAARPVPELSRLLVMLLKGVLYRDDDERLWASLLRLQARVREHAQVLLLELVLDEAEGHAFLRSASALDEDEAIAIAGAGAEGAARLPRLVARRPLSYPVSLLLALLRKRLAEFDAGGGDTRLVLSRDEIGELMRVFLTEGSNEARLRDQLDTTLNKVVELGFLRRLKPAAALSGAAAAASSDASASTSVSASRQARYEVRRILKAFVDAQWLADFDARLEVYRSALSAREGEGKGKGEGKDDRDA